MDYYYVYIIQSVTHHDRFYVGFTSDLARRLRDHNSDKLPNTARYKPWKIKSAHAFLEKTKAFEFEKYLKSPSGRAFAKKRL